MSGSCCSNSDSPLVEQLSDAQSESCCELHPPQRCGPTRCPACNGMGKSVRRITVGSLLKPEYRVKIPIDDEFCFCPNEACDVVYFLPGKVLFQKSALSVRIGLKETDPSVPVCYCFEWTPEKIKAEIEKTGKSTVIEQIKAQVKAGNCFCEITNPQGSCCLGNVSKSVNEALRLSGKSEAQKR